MSRQRFTPEGIREKVLTVVSEVSGMDASALNENLSIAEDIAPTSLDRVTLFMALEDEFEKSVAEEDLQGVDTLGKLIEFISQNLESNAG